MRIKFGKRKKKRGASPLRWKRAVSILPPPSGSLSCHPHLLPLFLFPLIFFLLMGCARFTTLQTELYRQIDSMKLSEVQKVKAKEVIQELIAREGFGSHYFVPLTFEEEYCTHRVLILKCSNLYEVVFQWYEVDSKGNSMNEWSLRIVKNKEDQGWETLQSIFDNSEY